MHVLSRIDVGPRERKKGEVETTFVREETGRKASLTAMTSLVDPPISDEERAAVDEERAAVDDERLPDAESDTAVSIAALCAAYLAEQD